MSISITGIESAINIGHSIERVQVVELLINVHKDIYEDDDVFFLCWEKISSVIPFYCIPSRIEFPSFRTETLNLKRLYIS
jgi:hypothetical protein